MTRLSVAASALVLAAGPAAAQTPPCGATITADITLAADMTCAGTALVIGADGITLDLGGYTLTGAGVTGSAGVANTGWRDGVITNGTIAGFFFGIHFEGASNNVIRGVTAEGNVLSGMYLEEGSDDNRIESSAVINNGTPVYRGNGITINSSDGNTVTRTLATGNQTQGIFVGGGAGTAASANTRIRHNTSYGNVSNGIGILGGSGHVVAENESTGNGGHGISFSSTPAAGRVTDSVIAGNVAAGNTLNGIALNDAHGNRLTGNDVSGNVLTGILLTGADGNSVVANRAGGNLVHGLLVRAGADRNSFSGNAFDGNGSRGISVGPGGGPAPAGNTFTGNRAEDNAGLFDVQDQTLGDGTAGTDSTYRGTRCETSNPPGICKP